MSPWIFLAWGVSVVLILFLVIASVIILYALKESYKQTLIETKPKVDYHINVPENDVTTQLNNWKSAQKKRFSEPY